MVEGGVWLRIISEIDGANVRDRSLLGVDMEERFVAERDLEGTGQDDVEEVDGFALGVLQLG